ncbi:MAG: hypothetical protein IJK03_05915 [Oscillospiraceae bacterium]|nr:hypothetical protein [Oscillospiraceae bacterium]
MLGKLMKYDLRSCVRKFWMLWAGLGALAILNGFTINHVLNNNSFEGFLAFLLGVLPLILFFILGVATAILILVFICDRFYKGLLGDEGYLAFTLPVSSAEHIASKALVSLILVVISGVVVMISAFLLFSVGDWTNFSSFLASVAQGIREISWPKGTGGLVVEMILFILAGSLAQTLHIYLAIAIGHLAKKHRVAYAILAYIGINIVLSMIANIIGSHGFKFLENLSFYIDSSGFHGSLRSALITGASLIFSQLVLCAAYFFGTKVILDRRLNLE